MANLSFDAAYHLLMVHTGLGDQASMWLEAGVLPAAVLLACRWGRCNGEGRRGGFCNRCGTSIDGPAVGRSGARL